MTRAPPRNVSAPKRTVPREQLKAEILQDLEAANAYVAKHGSFADMVREHYAASAEPTR